MCFVNYARIQNESFSASKKKFLHILPFCLSSADSREIYLLQVPDAKLYGRIGEIFRHVLKTIFRHPVHVLRGYAKVAQSDFKLNVMKEAAYGIGAVLRTCAAQQL